MKTLISLIIVLLSAVSCKTGDNKALIYNREIYLLIDKTDPLSVRPDIDHLFVSTGLVDNIWLGVKVTRGEISETDINQVEIISITAEDSWLGTQLIREAKVARFKKELKQKIEQMLGNATKSQEHSIIYRTTCRYLNALAKSKAEYKFMYVYTDCMENDSISFYADSTLQQIQTRPEVIKAYLERSTKLVDLTGINVSIMYTPRSYDDNERFMVVSSFFADIFRRKHAQVTIGNNIQMCDK
jgi:hypothetical protein